MKKLKLPKFHWVKILSLFFFVLLLGAYANIFAIGAKYAPGTTLDPACVPGELNCTVDIGGGNSPWLTSGSNIYYNNGNVGVGTDNPTKKLSVLGGVLISGGQSGTGIFELVAKDSLYIDSGAPSSVAVSGQYTYVTSLTTNTLTILNTSNPNDIIIVNSTSENLSSPVSVAISGNYAYVVNSGQDLVVYNISDPANILFVTSITSYFVDPRFITISGNYAFIADSGNYSVIVLDISDPENISYVNAMESEINPIFVTVAGNYAYVIDSYSNGTTVNGGIIVFDISDINNITQGGYLNRISNSIDGPNSIAVSGNYAYVTNISNNTLVIVDISNPNSLFVENTITTPYAQYGGVVISGNYAYVGDSNDSLYAFDISDPSNISEADSIANANIACITDLAYSNNHVYAVDGCSNSLNIFYSGQTDGTALDVSGGVAIGTYSLNSIAPTNGLIVSGNVGIGTDNPTSKLEIGLTPNFLYTQNFYESDGLGNSLDDATYSGSYTGGSQNWIYVTIDSEGATDTFSYSDDNGDCSGESNVPITGTIQSLCLGISIKFNSMTGHSMNDQWEYEINTSFGNTEALKVSSGGNNYFTINAVIPDSMFLGTSAGQNATFADNSNFLGYQAGYQATNASSSNFIGSASGYQASEASGSNFIGHGAGYLAVNAQDSNFFGAGSGTSATNADHSNFFGISSGNYAASASGSNFFGEQSGYNATSASNSNFFGYNSGNSAINANDSNFLGHEAGYGSNNASNSNFLGNRAGYNATNSQYSNFLGYNAGYYAGTAWYSNFIGYQAGSGLFPTTSNNSQYSNFFGYNTGYRAYKASNSIFIGQSAGYNDTVDNTGDVNNFSILIGKSTSTGGFSNSIAIGGSAVNTATNQFMIGSATRPINTTRINGSASTQCTITTGVGIACTSDERLKTNIVDLSADTLDKLIQVRTVNFNWKEGDNDMNNIGFLAQDLENYFPELVSTDSDGYKSVYYSNMTPILVESIRELDLKVKEFSSFDLYNTNSLAYLVKNYLADVGNGLEIVFFGEVRTKKLCLDDLCIDKTQLEQLLNNVNSTNNSSTDLVETETDNQPPETGEIDIADVVPAPDTLEETLMPIEVEEIDTQENTPAEEIVPILE